VSLEFRGATDEDAESVAAIANAYEAALVDEPDVLTSIDVLEWWRRGGERQLVLDTGQPIAFAFLQARAERYDLDAFVHPAAFGRGIGSRLVEWGEERARALGAAALRSATLAADERGACLLRARGFEYVRSFFRMVIDLDGPPAPAAVAAGFEVAPLAPGEERLLHAVIEDAFEDHWDHTRRTFDEWIERRTLEHELCFLVRAGGAVAAGAECRRELFGMGWVNTLGTRRSFRRLGLAEALLRHAFRELYARGARRIGLGVDAGSPTGATRLYERVGMRVVSQADLYGKSLEVG
jgi:ribosomal protein S18 acetylase RimI-like enzyme